MDYDRYLYYVWLNEIKGIGPVISRKLLKKFITAENIFYASIDDLKGVAGIGKETAEKIYNSKSLDKAKIILDKCNNKNINVTICNEDDFPESLNKFDNMPILLYYKGVIYKELMGTAIVGARRCTEYGKKVTVEAASFLSENKVPVISGMAKGIDSYAHTACLKSGGFTAAFLGCGVDICYPKEHNELMQKIIQNGVIISEYSPGIKPKPEFFPKRNRLISACSEKILVVEAGEKSGALITAKYAKEQGKTLYAVPNNIYLNECKGTNKLIYEGANIYLNPKQLLLNYVTNHNLYCKQVKSSDNNLSEIEKNILSLVKNNPSTVDEIIIFLRKEKSIVLNTLFCMEIEGKIKNTYGGRYVS